MANNNNTDMGFLYLLRREIDFTHPTTGRDVLKVRGTELKLIHKNDLQWVMADLKDKSVAIVPDNAVIEINLNSRVNTTRNAPTGSDWQRMIWPYAAARTNFIKHLAKTNEVLLVGDDIWARPIDSFQ